jgi:hypothetical protein
MYKLKNTVANYALIRLFKTVPKRIVFILRLPNTIVNYALIELLMIKLFLKRFVFTLWFMNFVLFLKLSEILFLAGNSSYNLCAPSFIIFRKTF